MRREALLLEDQVGRPGDVLQGVEQGAVEVEQHRAGVGGGRLGQGASSARGTRSGFRIHATEPHEHHAVAGDGGLEAVGERPEVLLPPQVADDPGAGQAQVGPPGGHRRVAVAAVEQADGLRAVFHVLGPDFEVAVLGHAAAGFAERVLIHVDHLVVGQSRPRVKSSRRVMSPLKMSGAASRHQSETCAYCSFGRERRGRRLALPVAQVAQQQVVGVVPAARAAELVQLLVGIEVEAVAEEGRGDALERAAEVAGGAPAVAADSLAPFPDVAHAVLAEVEDDVAGLPLQDVADQPVRLLQRGPVRASWRSGRRSTSRTSGSRSPTRRTAATSCSSCW